MFKCRFRPSRAFVRSLVDSLGQIHQGLDAHYVKKHFRNKKTRNFLVAGFRSLPRNVKVFGMTRGQRKASGKIQTSHARAFAVCCCRHQQCDQWLGNFFNVFGEKVSYKWCPNVWQQLFGLFWKISLSKNWFGYLLATFNSEIWSRWSLTTLGQSLMTSPRPCQWVDIINKF